MTEHFFTIPGDPRGWRIVTAVRGGKPYSNLAKNPKAWRKGAVWLLKAAWKGAPPLDGALGLRVVAVFPRPLRMECPHKPLKCWDREESRRLCSPEIVLGVSAHHTSTPDATNCHKLAEDALSLAGVIVDDRLVADYRGSKRYARRGEAPHVRISLWEL